jgi:hypothetical protein
MGWLLALVGLAVGLAACEKPADAPVAAAASRAESALQPTAGIKDIMAFQVDPAADALWESVSTLETATGIEEKFPKTDEEWWVARGHAIRLMEGGNLLLMEGRRVAMEGSHLEDHGTPGNLTAEESEKAIANDRATFVGFARALHDVGYRMLKAIDDKDPPALMDAGAALDEVCEGCHLKFWYPGQVVPRFPDQAPEVDAPQK